MTLDEACELIAEWRAANPKAWTGHGVEAAVAAALVPVDYDHLDRLRAQLATIPAKDITPQVVDRAVLASWPTPAEQVVRAIVAAVGRDLLAERMAPDPADPGQHFMVLHPNLCWPEGAEPRCEFHHIAHPVCHCARCQYLNRLGNRTAWMQAIEWSMGHDNDGRPLPRQWSKPHCPPQEPRRQWVESS